MIKKIKSYVLDVKVKEQKLVDKSNISNLTKNSDSNAKIATFTRKEELNQSKIYSEMANA